MKKPIVSNKKKGNLGFTLIEVMVVISIIGVFASVVFVALASARTKAKVTETVSDLKEINKALALYQSDHNGDYPCFDHNGADNYEAAWAAPYLKWPKNPLGVSGSDAFHWEHTYVGYPYPFTYSISLFNIGASNAQALDTNMDDGDLTTGNIRADASGVRLEYAGMDQTVIISSGCV